MRLRFSLAHHTSLLAKPPIRCFDAPMQTAESLRATWPRASNDSRRLPQTAVPRDFVFARDCGHDQRQSCWPEAPEKNNRNRRALNDRTLSFIFVFARKALSYWDVR